MRDPVCAPAARSRLGSLGKEAARYSLLLLLALIVLFFSMLDPRFFTAKNILDILRTASIIGLMAIGGVMIMISGEINFAIGSQVTLAATLIGKMMTVLPPAMYVPAILATTALIMVTGLAAGWIVTRFEVPAFLATFVLQMFLNGFIKLMTGNVTFYSEKWTGYYTFLGQTMLFNVIPLPLVLFIVVAVGSHIFLEHSKMGRYLFAVGANATASRQVGIRVDKIKIWGFVIGAAYAALAGIVLTSLFSDVQLNMGTELQTPAIAATVLSAAFYTVGKYNIPGAVVASVLTVVIQNGVVTAGGEYFYKDIVQGVFLTVAIAIIAMIREEGLPKVNFTR